MLVSVEDLWPKSRYSRLRFFDCRYQLTDENAGFSLYQQGHIDGAVYADLKRDLSGPTTGQNGRHPLPSPDQFIAWLSQHGVTADDTLIAYDSHDGLYASRLWWMWQWVGLKGHLLDGGYRQWTHSGAPISTTTPTHTPSELTLRADRSAWVDIHQLSTRLAEGKSLLIDARAPERYRGDVEPFDARAGHIPCAVNHGYAQHLRADGRFLPQEELRAQMAQLLQARAPETVIASCGSGVTACHVLYVLQYTGFLGATLYPGSFSEWSSDPNRVVVTGAEQGSL